MFFLTTSADDIPANTILSCKLFLFAYYSDFQETTDYTLSQIFFYLRLRLLSKFLLFHHSLPSVSLSSPEEYMQNLQGLFWKRWQLSSGGIRMASQKMKARYDTKIKNYKFSEGNKVWYGTRFDLKDLLSSYNQTGTFYILKRLNDILVRFRKSSSLKLKAVLRWKKLWYTRPILLCKLI